MGQEVTTVEQSNDILNHRIQLWKLEEILENCKISRRNHNGTIGVSHADVGVLEWAVNTLQVPPSWEEQLHKAQQEIEGINEELRRLGLEMENEKGVE